MLRQPNRICYPGDGSHFHCRKETVIVMTILYVLLAILMLGVLVMIHEFGHLLRQKTLSQFLQGSAALR